MKKYVTSKDLEFRTRGGLPFTVPAGAALEENVNGWLWVSPSALPATSIQRHDATHYGLRVSWENAKEAA